MDDNNLVAYYESGENWAHARRGVLFQRVVCALKRCSLDLIPFEEARSGLGLTQKVCRGLQTIELDHIRGSVGRPDDFTSAFLPRGEHLSERWQRVREVISEQGFPPIEVYQVGDAYFVAHGNHRVSIARVEGWKTIEAYVCEFLTPEGLSSDADLEEVFTKAANTELQEM